MPEYSKGARTLLNFFVSRHGEAVSRPGTTLVGENPDGFSDYVRFIPFVYSDTDAYVLVFTDGALYFLKDGAFVESSPGVPYTIATPYAEEDVAGLHYVQSGDFLSIAHVDYAPRELLRVAETNWTLTEISFARTAPVWKTFTSPVVGMYRPMVITSTLAVADATHPEREWQWKATMICQSQTTGRIYETLPDAVVSKFNGSPLGGGNVQSVLSKTVVLYSDKAITLRITGNTPPFGLYAGADPILAFNYYRGRGLLYGFVGQTTELDFVDVGEEPDYTKQPPKGTNPFAIYDNTAALLSTEHPRTLAYFQERLAFASTETRPGYLWFSKVGDYLNFDQFDFAPPGSPLEFDLFTRRREQVRSAVDLGRLLVFTSSTVRSMAGHQGEPLDALSVDAKLVEEIGANSVQPLVVDGCALYVRNKGQGIRALMPSQLPSGFQGADVSVHAQHFFVGVFDVEDADSTPLEVVDWCYQEDPWGVVWALRNDGVLLSLTFNPQGQSAGWAEQETDGTVLALCSIPEGTEDAVYIAVQREGTLCFERLTSRVRLGTIDDDICVDSAVRYSGAPTDTFTGLDHLEGKEVWVLPAGADPVGPYTVASGSITLEETLPATYGSTLVAHIGMAFTCDLETLDVSGDSVRTKQKTVKEVAFEVNESFSLEAGQDFEHLAAWDRTVDEGSEILSAATQLVRVPVFGTWDTGARACLRQSQPRPVTVVGIIREVDVGG